MSCVGAELAALDANDSLMQAIRSLGRLPKETRSAPKEERLLADNLRRARRLGKLSGEEVAELAALSLHPAGAPQPGADAMDTGGASQPAEEKTDAAALIHCRRVKAEAVEAKWNLRHGQHLAFAAARGSSLGPRELEILQKLGSGELRQTANAAIEAHGHGCLRAADGSSMDIGSSTGGRTRRLLDSYVIPSHENFLIE